MTGLPLITLTGLAPGSRLRVEYLRRRSAPELTYKVQFGNDLSNTVPDGWFNYFGAETVTPIDAFFERVVVEDTATTSTLAERFGRCTVEFTPAP